MKKIWIIMLFSLCLCKGGAEKESTVLKPKEFQSRLHSTPDAVLLDVRSLSEVKDGCIKGQINFDFNTEDFKTLVAGLDRNKTYFLYCAGGVRSAKAADMMEHMDFRKVYTLDGGFKAWSAEGLPVRYPMQK